VREGDLILNSVNGNTAQLVSYGGQTYAIMPVAAQPGTPSGLAPNSTQLGARSPQLMYDMAPSPPPRIVYVNRGMSDPQKLLLGLIVTLAVVAPLGIHLLFRSKSIKDSLGDVDKRLTKLKSAHEKATQLDNDIHQALLANSGSASDRRNIESLQAQRIAAEDDFIQQRVDIAADFGTWANGVRLRRQINGELQKIARDPDLSSAQKRSKTIEHLSLLNEKFKTYQDSGSSSAKNFKPPTVK
jgi:hypothetical protein